MIACTGWSIEFSLVPLFIIFMVAGVLFLMANVIASKRIDQARLVRLRKLFKEE
jgi:hypothetical protein